jgi:hypothetical protein
MPQVDIDRPVSETDTLDIDNFLVKFIENNPPLDTIIISTPLVSHDSTVWIVFDGGGTVYRLFFDSTTAVKSMFIVVE